MNPFYKEAFEMQVKRIGLLGAAVAAIGLAPLAAQANQIAYEGFDYAATEDITVTFTRVPTPAAAALLLGAAPFVRRRR